jgi:hypothetical protein
MHTLCGDDPYSLFSFLLKDLLQRYLVLGLLQPMGFPHKVRMGRLKFVFASSATFGCE